MVFSLKRLSQCSRVLCYTICTMLHYFYYVTPFLLHMHFLLFIAYCININVYSHFDKRRSMYQIFVVCPRTGMIFLPWSDFRVCCCGCGYPCSADSAACGSTCCWLHLLEEEKQNRAGKNHVSTEKLIAFNSNKTGEANILLNTCKTHQAIMWAQ